MAPTCFSGGHLPGSDHWGAVVHFAGRHHRHQHRLHRYLLPQVLQWRYGERPWPLWLAPLTRRAPSCAACPARTKLQKLFQYWNLIYSGVLCPPRMTVVQLEVRFSLNLVSFCRVIGKCFVYILLQVMSGDIDENRNWRMISNGANRIVQFLNHYLTLRLPAVTLL